MAAAWRSEVAMGGDGVVTANGLAEVYERHAPDAVRLAYLMTGDRSLAEDIAQEAFARMVSRLAFLRSPDATWPYLRRSVVNLSKNHYRHRAVERTYLASAGAVALTSHVDPDVVARESMRRALLRLPPRQRAALVLRFYEDLPEDQIADLLHCRPGTARSLVTRGVEALRHSTEVMEDA